MWIHGWKHSRTQNPVVLEYCGLASGIAEVGSSFPRVRASIWESAPQKVHGTEMDRSKRSICTSKMLKKLRRRSTLGRWSELAKSARYDFRKKKSKSTSTESSPVSALRKRWSIWCDAPAMQVCNRLWQNVLTRLRAAKQEWCCDAPGKRDCSWRVLNAS